MKEDGGMVANNWLSQYLSDIVNLHIHRPTIMEATALGAAYVAGLQAEIFNSVTSICENWQCERLFEPTMSEDNRQKN